MRGGHTQSHGTTEGGSLQLDFSHLRHDRYTLHVEGQRKDAVIVLR
jgi:hypothetical protein